MNSMTKQRSLAGAESVLKNVKRRDRVQGCTRAAFSNRSGEQFSKGENDQARVWRGAL
jgi:hypothetical protein